MIPSDVHPPSHLDGSPHHPPLTRAQIQYRKCIGYFKQGQHTQLLTYLDTLPQRDGEVYDVIRSKWLLLRGLVHMNRGQYRKANGYLWDAMDIQSGDDEVVKNLIQHMPRIHQDRRFVVHLEGYSNVPHSFSVAFDQIRRSFASMTDKVDLCCTVHPFFLKGMSKPVHDLSIYEEHSTPEKYMSTHGDRQLDLTIRVLYPPDIRPDPHAKHTLVFAVTETGLFHMDMFQTPLDPRVTIMTPSSHSERKLIQNTSLTSSQVSVIAHSYTESVRSEQEGYVLMRTRLAVPLSNTVCLHVSSNTGNKNVPLLLSVFEHIQRSASDPESLTLVIKFPVSVYNFPATMKLVQTYQDHPCIHILTEDFNNDEMSMLYQAADVYVAPYAAEGFNMPVLEAARYGKAIVCTTGTNCPTDEFVPPALLYGVSATLNDPTQWLQVCADSLRAQWTAAIQAIRTSRTARGGTSLTHLCEGGPISDLVSATHVRDHYHPAGIARQLYDQYLQMPFAVAMLQKWRYCSETPGRERTTAILDNVPEWRILIARYAAYIRRYRGRVELSRNNRALHYQLFTTLYHIGCGCNVHPLPATSVTGVDSTHRHTDHLSYDIPPHVWETSHVTPSLPYASLARFVSADAHHIVYRSIAVDSFFQLVEVMCRQKDVATQVIAFAETFDFEAHYIPMLPTSYFISTYISAAVSESIKRGINHSAQHMWNKAGVQVTNTPRRGVTGKPKLAIIGYADSFTNGAVARFAMCQYVALAQVFEIHLFVTDAKREWNARPQYDYNVHPKLQPHVCSITLMSILEMTADFWSQWNLGQFDQSAIEARIDNLDKLLTNDFAACFFPVVGCEVLSIYLSNLRLAPIQFSGYSHPVSSFGSCNTHYITSADFEDPESLRSHYTETPIPLKGFTTDPIPQHLYTTFPQTEMDCVQKYNDGATHVLVSANMKKITPSFLQLLARASTQWKTETGIPLHYHFYVGPCGRLFDAHATSKQVLCNDRAYTCTVHPPISTYVDYLRNKARCHVGVDSYPYSGCTTIIESMQIGVPTILMRGSRAVSRCTTYLYECNCDHTFEHLVGSNEDDYIQKLLRLCRSETSRTRTCGELRDQLRCIAEYHTDIIEECAHTFHTLVKELVTFVSDGTGTDGVDDMDGEKRMCTNANGPGRLGNQFFRMVSASLLAMPLELSVHYDTVWKTQLESLGIRLFSGSRRHPRTMQLTDGEYMQVLSSAHKHLANVNYDFSQAYFQTRLISQLVWQYLHTSDMHAQIVQANPHRERYSNNKDLFVHIRLDDAAQWNPGKSYYCSAISSIPHETLYISTDQISHSLIQQVCAEFPEAHIVRRNAIDTLQFGSTCRHIVLSHGSYSALLGYLAFDADVYYCNLTSLQIDTPWCGDMFTIYGWHKLSPSPQQTTQPVTPCIPQYVSTTDNIQFTIVLVSVGIVQPYIRECLTQLHQMQYKHIVVIMDGDQIEECLKEDVFQTVDCVDCQTLDVDTLFHHHSQNTIDTTFRKGFWRNCALRMFLLYAYMHQHQCTHCIHIENDVMLYVHFQQFAPHLNTRKVHLVMDSETRGVPSIMYVPEASLLKPLVHQYDFQQTDMGNLAKFYHTNRSDCTTFPIYPAQSTAPDHTVMNHATFQGGVFDGAAIGQYLGGVDPRNQSGDTSGFINETCVVTYDTFRFEWRKSATDAYWKPVLCDGDRVYPVYNLHIHSKRLRDFSMTAPTELARITKCPGVSPAIHTPITGENIQWLCDHFIGDAAHFEHNPNMDSRQKRKCIRFEQLTAPFYNKRRVFCYTHALTNFKRLADALSLLINPFVLVLHNSDEAFLPVHTVLLYTTPQLKHIFTLNNHVINHPHITSLPIGLANSQWTHGDWDTLARVRDMCPIVQHGIFFNFSVNTHPTIREACKALLVQKGLQWTESTDYETYLHTLKAHRYCICPVGNGLDTHRFWECQYLNVIPICVRNPMVDYWAQHYPVVRVHTWEDVNIHCVEESPTCDGPECRRNVDSRKLDIQYIQSLLENTSD